MKNLEMIVTELTSQLAKMNCAPEDKKMDLLADIATQFVKQRTARDASHAKMQEKMMQEKMMQHMMEHMQMGKESMSQCPMMKDMKGIHKNADTTPMEVHKEEK